MLLPNGKRGFLAAIQGLHALSLASLDAIRSNGCLRQPFQALSIHSDNRNEHRDVLSLLPANKSTSFKGRAAQQTEHREAMRKQEGSRQIKLACI